MFMEGRLNRYITPTLAAGLLMGIGGTACGGKSENLCPGQRLGSSNYLGDPHAVANDQSTWHTGVLIETVVPPSAKDVIAEYKKPSSDVWTDSKPIDPAKAGHIALKIGRGDVVFAIRIEAPVNSVDCDMPPQSTFEGPEDWGKITAQDVTLPEWPKH